MKLQNPDLYLFLGLLAGFAALLAIISRIRAEIAGSEPSRSTVTEKARSPPRNPSSAIAAEGYRSAIRRRSIMS